VLNSALLLGNAGNAEQYKEQQQKAVDEANKLPDLPPPPSDKDGVMAQFRYQWAVAKRNAMVQARAKVQAAQEKEAAARQQAAASTAKAVEKMRGERGDSGLDSVQMAGAMSSLFNDTDDTTQGAPMVKLGDASIAAPFTCKSKNMTAICDIVRLGRCTLVTTLQMYKILALNCLISAYTMAVLFSDGIKFSQTQMVSSGIVIAVCFLFLSRSKPLDTLAPQRPINRVFHPYQLVSIGGQFAVHLRSLAASVELVHGHDPDALHAQREGGEEEGDFSPTLLNSIVFLMTTLMTATTFAVNYKGHPFMTSLKDNRPLLVALIILAALVGMCAFEADAEFNEYFEIVKMPSDKFRQDFLQLLAFDVVAAFAVEYVSHFALGRLP